MTYLRNRAEQLADYLRSAIANGTISEPLPTLRNWSKQLKVSTHTLQDAIKILKREGWLGAKPRENFYLLRKPFKHKPNTHHQPVVRWLMYDKRLKYSPIISEIVMAITQKLTIHNISLYLEVCNNKRLDYLYKQGERYWEVLALASIPLKYQQLFEHFKNALLIGSPEQGIKLPYISIDVFSAIRHAVFLLLRNGFTKIYLLISKGTSPQMDEKFNRLLEEAKRVFPDISGKVVRIPNTLYEQNHTICGFITEVRKGNAIITVEPIPAGLVLMALLKQRVAVPAEVNIVGINCVPTHIQTLPLLIHYPYPIERFAREVSMAIIHYFESGALPALAKEIPLKMVNPVFKSSG